MSSNLGARCTTIESDVRVQEVRIDIDAMNLIANIQAQTYYSNAIEAHLLNKPHPGLRTEPTPAV